jgi:nucleotidyltransferase/DNA polymerase involved in DNA repair
MGHEVTLPYDIDSRERLGGHLLRLSDQVARRMRQDGYLGRIVSLKLRDSKFKTTIRQRALPILMADEELIYKTASALLDENWDKRPVRLIGVSASGLVPSGQAEQPSLFDSDEHRRKMTEAADSIRNRFGDEALVRAGSLE